MADPLPAHKRAEILVKAVAGDRAPPRRDRRPDLRRGRQAAQGRQGRGEPRDVDLHVRGRRGAQARGRGRAHGRRPGGRGQARVHAPGADRDRRRDQPVQLPAQPRRAQDRARARGRLCRRAQAGGPDSAVRAARSRSSRTRRACRRAGSTSSSGPRVEIGDVLVEDERVKAITFTGSVRGRLGHPRARGAKEGAARARQRDAGDRPRRRRSRRGDCEAGGERLLLRGAELHLGPAHLRAEARVRRVRGRVRPEGRGARGRRPGRRATRMSAR